jgi:hypothetical protein
MNLAYFGNAHAVRKRLALTCIKAIRTSASQV